MSTGFKVPINIITTGWSQSGKSEQARRVFNAHEPVSAEPDSKKRYPFRPMLVVHCDPSTAATMADVLAHKMCTSVPVEPDGEKFAAALATAIEAGHSMPNGTVVPFASVFFDGWTSLAEGARGDAREAARTAEAGADATDRKKSVDQKDTSNDERKLSAAANREVRTAIKAWNSHVVTMTGVVFLSTAHADEKWMPKLGARIQVGEQLDLPPKARRWLFNGCNAMVLLQRILPEVASAEDLDAADIDDPSLTPSYVAIMKPVVVGGYELDLIKYQRGLFAGMPVRWHDPDMGVALLTSPLRK